MNNKTPRTKIGNLPPQPRTLDLDELADVTGGIIRGGVGGAGPAGGTVSTWTWTDPQHRDDIYRKDDE